MPNVRTSKKWLSVVAKDDGTAEEIIRAMIEHEDKLASREGVKVVVNGCSYVVKDSPTKPPRM